MADVRGERTKGVLADALLDLCEERRLAEIAVSDVTERAQVARQTFYRHFDDMDDLVCFTASRPLLSGELGVYDIRNMEQAYRESLRHRGFYTQLPLVEEQYSYRATLTAWLRETSYVCFIDDDLSDYERAYRKLRIDMFHAGGVQMAYDWYASGMAESVDLLMEALYESAPAFMREGSFHTPRLASYPRRA